MRLQTSATRLQRPSASSRFPVPLPALERAPHLEVSVSHARARVVLLPETQLCTTRPPKHDNPGETILIHCELAGCVTPR